MRTLLRTAVVVGLAAGLQSFALTPALADPDLQGQQPPAADAQPGQAPPTFAKPSYASNDEKIHGVVAGFDGKYGLSVRDDRGFVDNVTLHDGTIINPTGLRLANGMTVTIYGHNAGSAFSANEIDTPYVETPAVAYAYPAYGYPYYGYYGYPYYDGFYGGFYPGFFGLDIGFFGGRGFYPHGFYGGYHGFYGGYRGYYGGGYHGGYAYGRPGVSRAPLASGFRGAAGGAHISGGHR